MKYYQVIKKIGWGAFGKVLLAKHRLTGKRVAIKQIDKKFMNDEFNKNKVIQEVFILQKISHSNIIRLLEVFEDGDIMIVMEYAKSGDLLEYIRKQDYLEEEVSKRIFRQVLIGLAHIHTRSIIHRDIKLDNILIGEDETVKICDFGVSKIIPKDPKPIREQCGTPAYIAPEIIADKGYLPYLVDIWSLGIMLYALLESKVPFRA